MTRQSSVWCYITSQCLVVRRVPVLFWLVIDFFPVFPLASLSLAGKFSWWCFIYACLDVLTLCFYSKASVTQTPMAHYRG